MAGALRCVGLCPGPGGRQQGRPGAAGHVGVGVWGPNPAALLSAPRGSSELFPTQGNMVLVDPGLWAERLPPTGSLRWV